MSNTRFILTGVGALALLGASVVPSVPSFAAEGNAGAQTQQAISTLPGGQNTGTNNTNGNNTNINTGAKVTSVEGGPLNPLTGQNNLTITGEGIDLNKSFDGLGAEVYEVDADGDFTGENLVQDGGGLVVTEDGHFRGTAKVKGDFDPQKHYVLYIMSYPGHGNRTIEAKQDLPVQQVDSKDLQSSVTLTTNSSEKDKLSSHLNTNVLTLTGTHFDDVKQVKIKVEGLDENGQVNETLATKDVSAEVKNGNFTTQIQIPGSKIQEGKHYRVLIESSSDDWVRAVTKDFYGDTDDEVVGIINGAPLSRSAAENHLKVAGGGFNPAAAAQNGSKVRLIFTEYNVELDDPSSDEIVNTTVTPKPNGDFEGDLTIPGNKLQAGKKYVVRAYLEYADGGVASDITLKTLVPTTN